MAGPSYFVKALIRVARTQGRQALENVILGQYQTISEGGGKTLVSSSIGGKSYSFQVPESMSADKLMEIAEEALEYFDGSTPEQVDAMLTRRPMTLTRVRF